MNLGDAFRATLRYWWVVALAFLLTAGPAYALASSRADVYQSTGRVVLGPGSTVGPASVVESTAALDGSFTATFAEILVADGTLDRVVTANGLDDPTIADYKVTSSVVPETNVIEVTVRGPDAELVHVLAAGLTNTAIEAFTDFYPVYEAVPLSEPQVPQTPLGSGVESDTVLGGAAGLLVGVSLAVGIDRARLRRLRLEGVESVTLRLRGSGDDAHPTSGSDEVEARHERVDRGS